MLQQSLQLIHGLGRKAPCQVWLFTKSSDLHCRHWTPPLPCGPFCANQRDGVPIHLSCLAEKLGLSTSKSLGICHRNMTGHLWLPFIIEGDPKLHKLIPLPTWVEGWRRFALFAEGEQTESAHLHPPGSCPGRHLACTPGVFPNTKWIFAWLHKKKKSAKHHLGCELQLKPIGWHPHLGVGSWAVIESATLGACNW